MPTIPQLRPWKAIQSGELSYEELFIQLKANKIGHSAMAEDLLNRRDFPATPKRQVNFGRVRHGELGLRHGSSTAKAVASLEEMGFELQPFAAVYAFELALACAHEKGMGTLVIPLPRFWRYSVMYVNSPSAGYTCSVRVDQKPSKLEEDDWVTFVLPE
jgi:hypothetical protein